MSLQKTGPRIKNDPQKLEKIRAVKANFVDFHGTSFPPEPGSVYPGPWDLKPIGLAQPPSSLGTPRPYLKQITWGGQGRFFPARGRSRARRAQAEGRNNFPF